MITIQALGGLAGALKEVAGATEKASLTAASIAAYKVRGGINKYAKSTFEQGGVSGLSVRRATSEDRPAMVFSRGWTEEPLQTVLYPYGEKRQLFGGVSVFVPNRRRVKGGSVKKKLAAANGFGFAGKMKSGKIGLFMRTGFKQKQDPTRDAIGLLFSIRTPQEVEALIAKGKEIAEKEYEPAFNTAFREVAQKILGDGIRR